MRLKLDENLPSQVAELCEDPGWSCLTVSDQGLAGHPDSRIAQACREEERVLVTLDVGFANIHSYPPEEHHGIVVLRPSSQAKPHVLEVFRRLVTKFREKSPTGELWIVEDQRIRIR